LIRKISNGFISTVAKTSSDVIAYAGGFIYFTPYASTSMVVSQIVETFLCNNVNSTVSSVCSGHGLCYNNTCQCEAGYYGNGCQYYDCTGFEHNHVLTCSGNGVCIGPNTCQCKEGYYGDGCFNVISGGGPSSKLNINYGSATGFYVDPTNNYVYIGTPSYLVTLYPNGTLARLAGTGVSGFNGEGISSLDAQVNNPTAMFVYGNEMFFVDSGNHRLRKVGTDGIISTVAGTGVPGYSGDGYKATSALLDTPTGITVNTTSGEIYISDTNNNRIRKIYNGIISTIAGSDGTVIAPKHLTIQGGLLHFVDGNKVKKISSGTTSVVAGTGTASFSGDNGVATSATLNTPTSCSFSSTGEMYIADSANIRIRKVNALGNILTVTGTGTSANSEDTAVLSTSAITTPKMVQVVGDTPYVLDSTRLFKLENNAKTLVYTAGFVGMYESNTGPKSYSGIIKAIQVSKGGEAYVSEYTTTMGRIRKVTRSSIATIVGTGLPGYSGDLGQGTVAKVNQASGLYVVNGDVYFADVASHKVRKFTGASGVVFNLMGTGVAGSTLDGNVASSSKINSAYSVAIASNGDIYFSDTGNHVVRKITFTNGIVYTFAGSLQSGSYSGDSGQATSATLNSPRGMHS